MRTIFKYPLSIKDTQDVRTFEDAVPLTAQMQREELVLWMEVDTERKLKPIRIHIFGTGHAIPNINLKYINSVQVGVYVWHVYMEEL